MMAFDTRPRVMKPKFQLLHTEAATDLASGGGAAAETAAPEAAAAAEETPAPAAAEPREPSFLETIAASVKSKGSLVAENKHLTERAVTAETALSAANKEIASLREELETLRTERVEAQKLIAAAAEEKQSVEAKAADIVATEIGFSAAELPSGVKAGETKDELQAELAACQDNARRYEIAGKIAKLEGFAIAN